ncbi:SET domain containing 2 [Haematobia irritans]|uniref:SET domain containing 2 n=1 Tax=Haematobia irritans TaxID=7368 RepID=UPI003F4FD5CC
MDTTNVNVSNQRTKRGAARIAKGSNDTITMDTQQTDCEDAIIAISPTLDTATNPAIVPVSECRRSSRKKIIKFDVRDLLNKNRKPHKIQIEARIDSNVPSKAKNSAVGGPGDRASTSSGLAGNVQTDLSSKQKTFMEKSAIFRRYSISQEHTKPPPPPLPPMPPPTILSKVGVEKDASGNVLLKPKQTTSLIVAQVESNVRSAETKRKSTSKGIPDVKDSNANEEEQLLPQQQKRRGRPPKTRPQPTASSGPTNEETNTTEEQLKITPEKATNWKEYKACLAQIDPKHNVTEEMSVAKNEVIGSSKVISIQQESKQLLDNEETMQISKHEECNVQDLEIANTESGSKEKVCETIEEKTKPSIVTPDVKKASESFESSEGTQGPTVDTSNEHKLEIQNSNVDLSKLKVSSPYSPSTTSLNTSEHMSTTSTFDKHFENKSDAKRSKRISNPTNSAENLVNKSSVPEVVNTSKVQQIKKDEENKPSSSKRGKRSSYLPEMEKPKRNLRSPPISPTSVKKGNENSSSHKSMTIDIDSPGSNIDSNLLNTENNIVLSSTETSSSVENEKQEVMTEDLAVNDQETKDNEVEKIPDLKDTKQAEKSCSDSSEIILSDKTDVVSAKTINIEEHKEDVKLIATKRSTRHKKSFEFEHSTILIKSKKCGSKSQDDTKGTLEHTASLVVADEELKNRPKSPELIPLSQTEGIESKSTEALPLSTPTHLKEESKTNLAKCSGNVKKSKEDENRESNERIKTPTLLDNGSEINLSKAVSPKMAKEKDDNKAVTSKRHKRSQTRKITKVDSDDVSATSETPKESVSKNEASITQSNIVIAQLESEANYKEKVDDMRELSSNFKSKDNSYRDVGDINPVSETVSCLSPNELLSKDNIEENTNKGEDKNGNSCMSTATPHEKNDSHATKITKSKSSSSKQRKSLRNHKESTIDLRESKEETKVLESIRDEKLKVTVIESKLVLEEDQVTDLEAKQKETNSQEENKIENNKNTIKVQSPPISEIKTVDEANSKNAQELVSQNEKLVYQEQEEYAKSKAKVATSRKSTRNQKDVCNETKDEDESITKIIDDCGLATKEENIAEQQVDVTKKKSTRNQKETINEKEFQGEIITNIGDESVAAVIEENITDKPNDVPKRKPRKSRFKNLHGPEENELDINTMPWTVNATVHDESQVREDSLQSESDSQHQSTSIENSSEPLEVITKITESEQHQSSTSKDYNINLIPQSSLGPDSTNVYVMKNVSIETNTLLDILRTVQSNKEAAQALPSKSENLIEKSDVSQTMLCAEKLKKATDSKSNSPNRSSSASPLTLKKGQLNSPCRSDASSPSILKKSNVSPSRSHNSSPLVFNKKVTRRYERRSRRGEDEPAHKTLEETFAEIAALSSKAVLEMTSETTSTDFQETEKSTNSEMDIAKETSTECITESYMPDEIGNDTQSVKDETTPTRKSKQSRKKEQSPSPGDSEKGIKHAYAIQQESVVLNVTSANADAEESPASAEEEKHIAVKESGSEIHKDNKVDPTSLKIADDIPIEMNVENQGPSENNELLRINSVEDNNGVKSSESIGDNNKESIETEKRKEEQPQTPKQMCNTPNSPCDTKGSYKKHLKKQKSFESGDNLIEEHKSATTTPTKRGKRGKSSTHDQPNTPSSSSSSSKKKNSKEQQSIDNKIAEEENETWKDLDESDSTNADTTNLEKSFDEKMAKKKRQRKLKEAFEAALKDKPLEKHENEPLTPSSSPTFGLRCLNKSPPPPTSNDGEQTTASTSTDLEDDPLKDIEKFIEDGVNLLKKGYKIDEDSVDNVIPSKTTDNLQSCQESNSGINTGENNKDLVAFSTFETPADTPIATPSVTPPPKSPEISSTPEDELTASGGVRRSHRIKLITKMPKALVGRGLVRDKERFSIKDDVETKSHYTLDDHLLDLAEVEAKNAKFLKEMEERLSNFQVIKENEYKCERVISKEARKMICDCFLTPEEEERGELACGEDCLNRLLMIECGNECNVKERCTNKRFQKFLCSPCRVFRTEKKGFGIMADIEILPGEFIMEYVGEVIDTVEFERRRIEYSEEKNRHYYFMALRSDAIIDATIKGNISRFINHSCDPNAETQKWTVNGELRIGFFSRKSIMPGEEITFDYQYQRYGREAQRCYCESANCRGWIGQEPNSDEGEQIDEDDESEDDEEDATANLLEDDDDDSDASVSDPDEVQKKLEMAAAQAEVELAPISLSEKVLARDGDEFKTQEGQHENRKSEEDSKSKFKKLLSKMAEKVAAKNKQTKREKKLQRKKKSKESSVELANKPRSLEDPDIEDEVEFLSRCGLKTQSDTLRLSRLMVRAKLLQTRLNLLSILRKGELPCRRLFLDYHGLRLLHGWMSEDAGNMLIRLALLQTLELLPVANKTVLTDSKVMQVVRNWCGSSSGTHSPSEDSLSSNSNSQDGSTQPINNEMGQESVDGSGGVELQKLASKLISSWESLPEIFRIPKKERIEQMKEHEREADRQYAENEGGRYSRDQYRADRFGRRFNSSSRFARYNSKPPQQQLLPRQANVTPEHSKNLSKTQRRELFAAKVARDEAEKRMAEERREFETKCRFFGLDPKKTRPQDVPFCVNPATGQWYSVERKPITIPPSYAHVQVPVKPKSTNPIDYQLPTVCNNLPPQWKFAITPLGQIYYYHVQYRVPQWEPPTPAQLQMCENPQEDVDSGNEHSPTTGADSSEDDDDILIGMDAAQLKAYINRKVENRRQKRYQRLVDERAISPRREEDRIYNQIEVRKYKENKEKIRKRKEEIRRKRSEALRQSALNMCTLGSLTDSTVKIETEDDMGGIVPIQDYLLSSDEDEDIKADINSPLIDKIVEGEKIVDELDALTTKRPMKRPLPSHRDFNESIFHQLSPSMSASSSERLEYKKRKLEKKEKRKPKEQDAKYRKNKEKFRCEIAGIIVHHLKPYRKDSCTVGRIKCDEDFNHLARKLTHFVMIKELKYCESVGQTLVVTESVKNKSREFIKKYMAKYGDVYIKPTNDPEFKDIPFTL